MNKKDVYIKIKGVQIVDDQSDTTELFTLGSFYKKNNNYYISYDETETSGFGFGKTVLKIEGSNKVTLLRSGETKSHLIIENGQRNVGHYDTMQGDVMIGVYTKALDSKLSDAGGDVYFQYNLDINSSLISENEVFINVKEKTLAMNS